MIFCKIVGKLKENPGGRQNPPPLIKAETCSPNLPHRLGQACDPGLANPIEHTHHPPQVQTSSFCFVVSWASHPSYGAHPPGLTFSLLNMITQFTISDFWLESYYSLGPGYLSVVHGLVAESLPESLVHMQNLGPYPRPTESESSF